MTNFAPLPEMLGAHWIDKEEDTLAWTEKDNLLMKISKLPILDQGYIQLNQNRKPEHYYACTYYASVWAICDVMGYDEATYIKLVDATVEEATKSGDYNPKTWAFTATSAQIACKVHNQLMPKKISTFRTEIGKSTFYTLLAHNYTMVVTYISWTGYRDDAKDWKLDGVDFKNAKWGHCIRWSNLEKHTKVVKPTELIALDNYYWTNNVATSGFKRYSIPVTNIPFLKGEPYYAMSYFFIPSDLL
jgi:hypothetical protein